VWCSAKVSSEEEDIWRSRIVYSGEVLGVGGFSVVHAAKDGEDEISQKVSSTFCVVHLVVGCLLRMACRACSKKW